MIRLFSIFLLAFLVLGSSMGTRFAGSWIAEIEIEKDAEQKEEKSSEESFISFSGGKNFRKTRPSKSQLIFHSGETQSTKFLSHHSTYYYSTRLAFTRDLVVLKQAFII